MINSFKSFFKLIRRIDEVDLYLYISDSLFLFAIIIKLLVKFNMERARVSSFPSSVSLSPSLTKEGEYNMLVYEIQRIVDARRIIKCARGTTRAAAVDDVLEGEARRLLIV